MPFEPFPSSAMIAEANREAAARSFRSVAAQIAVVLAACGALGLAFMLSWHQLALYDAALATCGGV